MQSLTITLPLPPRVLTSNVSVHYMPKSGATKRYKTAAFYATLDAINRDTDLRRRIPFGAIKIESTFFFNTDRRRDDDNWGPALKAARDGIAKAGVVRDDTTATTLPPILKLDRDNPRVELVVTETTQNSERTNDEKEIS